MTSRTPPENEFVHAFVAPHVVNTLVVPEVFVIDLYIDPADPRTHDDVYRLLNDDGSEHQRRVAADDAVPGDDLWRLEYQIGDIVFNEFEAFTIYFDPARYGELGVPTTTNPSRAPLVTTPRTTWSKRRTRRHSVSNAAGPTSNGPLPERNAP